MMAKSALKKVIEPGHSISYKIACGASEVSDQPVYLHKLIRVFAVCLKALDSWLTSECPANTAQIAQMFRLI